MCVGERKREQVVRVRERERKERWGGGQRPSNGDGGSSLLASGYAANGDLLQV
jgi:hypothetical protein